jgi:UDP-glucose-4-epimerase GalE
MPRNWKEMRMAPNVLVTGGAGYIGSHVCKRLAAAGYCPVVFDNLSRGHRDFVRWGPIEVGDIADEALVMRALRRHRPVAVIHFAGLTYVGESVSDPLLYYGNNVVGSWSLLRAMRRCGVTTLVFSSTCATYAPTASTVIAEDTPQQPSNPYGSTKLMIERMIADCCSAYGLRSSALRYFNACGADPDGETGERHDPETHLIPRILMAAAGELPSIEIFGTDYRTPDGTCIRDYIHVDDLARAHVQALAYLLEGGAPAVFNLGTGIGHSVLEVVATAERVTGKTVPLCLSRRRPGDAERLIADPRRAELVLGFRTRWSLEAAIQTAWNWHLAGTGRPAEAVVRVSPCPPPRSAPSWIRDRIHGPADPDRRGGNHP